MGYRAVQLEQTPARNVRGPMFTGLEQYRHLKERMGDRLAYVAAGQVIEL